MSPLHLEIDWEFAASKVSNFLGTLRTREFKKLCKTSLKIKRPRFFVFVLLSHLQSLQCEINNVQLNFQTHSFKLLLDPSGKCWGMAAGGIARLNDKPRGWEKRSRLQAEPRREVGGVVGRGFAGQVEQGPWPCQFGIYLIIYLSFFSNY